MSTNSKNLSLPPFCEGTVRGNLIFVIEQINWKTSKSFNNIKVNILWWGQQQGYSSEILNTTYIKKPAKIVKYQIRTNQQLFRSYLKNCEPLLIQLYSSKTNDFIGNCKLDIFSNLKTDCCCKIFSKRHFELGEIKVSLKIQNMNGLTLRNQHFKTNESQMELASLNILSKKTSVDKENISPVQNKKNLPNCTLELSQDVLKEESHPTYLSDQELKKSSKLRTILIEILKANFDFSDIKYQKVFTSQNNNSEYVFKCAITSKQFKGCSEMTMLSTVFIKLPLQRCGKLTFLYLFHNSRLSETA